MATPKGKISKARKHSRQANWKLSLPGIRVADNPDRSALDVAALTGGRPLWLEDQPERPLRPSL